MTIIFLKNSAVADHNIIALGPSAIFGPSEATRTCLGSIFSYSALISRTCVWTASFQQMLSISLKTLWYRVYIKITKYFCPLLTSMNHVNMTCVKTKHKTTVVAVEPPTCVKWKHNFEFPSKVQFCFWLPTCHCIVYIYIHLFLWASSFELIRFVLELTPLLQISTALQFNH